MRAAFGLVGILVVVGVIVWYMQSTELPATQQALKTGQAMQEQITQMSGHDANGVPANQSATFDSMEIGGKTTALLVTKVASDGAYANYFGLMRNDAIVAIESQGFRQNIKDIGDPELAKAQVMDTFQKSGSIYVKRGDQELKLPQPKTAAQPAAQPSAQNSNPPPAQEQKSALDRALAPIQSMQNQGQ